jgi:glycosyltransferase involved in cell wall biosynthesis
VIRLGIDLDRRIVEPASDGLELRRAFGVPEDAFVVGWIGRMTSIKHLPDVLAAFARLREKRVDARLVLVGDGPDREDVEQRAHELGIARFTLYLGYQRDIAPYYALFDALLLPSGNEGTPVVAIESLAAGTPVVATRVGGIPDVVSDGVDGLLAEPGDVEELAAALEKLAHDAGLRERMGLAGRERTLPRYRVERLVGDVDALYRELLAERGLPLPPLPSEA